MLDRDQRARRWLQILAIYGMSVAAVVGLLNIENRDPDGHAVVLVGLGLIIIWCMLGGTLMFSFRGRFVRWVASIRVDWRVRFVALSTVMALVEEAVTTALTNAGPLLGGTRQAARITLSANYFEVISHSVLAFIPWFVCWAWLLHRYDFRALEVMLLFGLTGAIAEATLDSSLGIADLGGVGMWVFVYGLMVYLPAHTIPVARRVRPARWYHVPLAVFLPLVFIVPFTLGVTIEASRRGASGLRRVFGQ